MDRISGIVVFLLGASILWLARFLSTGSLRSPGPGFFPTLVAAVLVILSLFLILRGKKRGNEGESLSARSFIRIFVVFVVLLAYFLFLEYLGFVITSFFLMTFLFLWV